MNQEEVAVYPNKKKIMNICKFRYTILEFKLFESIRIAVYLFNETDILIEAKQYIIQGDEYANWSNDDKYIINLLKQKIQDDL